MVLFYCTFTATFNTINTTVQCTLYIIQYVYWRINWDVVVNLSRDGLANVYCIAHRTTEATVQGSNLACLILSRYTVKSQREAPSQPAKIIHI